MEIADEVYQYLVDLKKIEPILANLHLLPPSAKLPEIPDKPDCLSQHERQQRWGFSNPGTWMDQPFQYMDDTEAARKGKARFESELLAEMQTASDLASSATPFPAPLLR